VDLPDELFPEMQAAGLLHIAGGERGRPRMVPLNYQVCLALAAYIKQKPSPSSQALFVNRFGKPLSPRGVEKILGKYLAQSSIGDASVQSLRHTFAIYHLTHGTSLKALQEIMGFKGARSTAIYSSFARDWQLPSIDV